MIDMTYGRRYLFYWYPNKLLVFSEHLINQATFQCVQIIEPNKLLIYKFPHFHCRVIRDEFIRNPPSKWNKSVFLPLPHLFLHKFEKFFNLPNPREAYKCMTDTIKVVFVEEGKYSVLNIPSAIAGGHKTEIIPCQVGLGVVWSIVVQLCVQQTWLIWNANKKNWVGKFCKGLAWFYCLYVKLIL